MSAGVIRVTDETTKAEIAEAMLHLRESQKRVPAVMVERFHARYDALLTDWERARA